MNISRLIISLTLPAVSFCTTAAYAGDSPENSIKYRQAMMKALGGHTGAAAQIAQGKVNPEGHLQMHADAIANLSKEITALFPEGSDFGDTPTRAKPEVWEKWDDFKKAADASAKAANEFAQAAGSGNKEAIGAKFQALGKSCKGCHKDFREKQE